MKPVHVAVSAMLLTFCSLSLQAQQTVATNTNVVVPPLVNFSGTLIDTNGRPETGKVAITFSLYSEPTGGAALWMETQNVEPDSRGHYTVMLGSTSNTGLPADIFVAGEAHWLGVQVQGQDEQPRVLLVSAPYALKAGDAQTLGGLPASAFVLAAPTNGPTAPTTPDASATTSISVTPATTSDVTTSGGTVNALPLFSTATNIQNSLLTQTGTTTISVGGKLNLPALGTATSTAGSNSRPLDFVASAYDSSTAAAVAQTFQWQAEATGNDTSTASGTMNLLYALGTATPAETGLHISNKGLITFATGQTFPGTGKGTITGVTAGTDLTGGGTSGTVTLNLNTTKVPLLSAANAFIGNQAITGNLTDTGNITATGALTAQSEALNYSTVGSYALTINNASGTGGINVIGGNTANEISAFTSGVDGQAIIGTASGTQGTGVSGSATGSNGTGVFGTAASGGIAVRGDSTGGTGVYGLDQATTGSSIGVVGYSASADGEGVFGYAPIGEVGVWGQAPSTGVWGQAITSSGTGVMASGGATGYGIQAASGNIGIVASGTSGYGVEGVSSNVGVYGASSGPSIKGAGFDRAGVWGDTGGTNESFIGVLGTADDNAAGVFENNSPNGIAALFAQANTTTADEAIGFLARADCCSNEEGSLATNAGIWGDTGAASGTSAAIIGTADDNWSAKFYNDSATHTTLNGQNDTTTSTALVFKTIGSAFKGECTIDVQGNLHCTGSTSADVSVDGGSRKVALHAIVAPENWFEDFGSSVLADGKATIVFDPTFAQTVNTTLEYHVFLTPKGESAGLYVSNETPQAFEVHEQHGGHSNIAFDYRIVAKRAGFENVRLEDVTEKYRQSDEELAWQQQHNGKRPMLTGPRRPAVSSHPPTPPRLRLPASPAALPLRKVVAAPVTPATKVANSVALQK